MTLTDGELESIRLDFEEQILDQTCTIQTLTLTADGLGSFTKTWADTYKNVPCRLGVDSRAAALGIIGERESYPDSYTLNVMHDQAIAEGDRVVAGGVTYEVTHVKDSSVQWVFLRAAQLRRLDG